MPHSGKRRSRVQWGASGVSNPRQDAQAAIQRYRFVESRDNIGSGMAPVEETACCRTLRRRTPDEAIIARVTCRNLESDDENQNRACVICFSDNRDIYRNHRHGACRGVLPVRQLSGELRCQARRRAQDAPGRAGRGTARNADESWRSCQSRRSQIRSRPRAQNRTACAGVPVPHARLDERRHGSCRPGTEPLARGRATRAHGTCHRSLMFSADQQHGATP